MPRRLRHLGITAASALLLAPAVGGATGPQQPSGSINARGTGTALVNGNLVLVGAVNGPAVLTVHDRIAPDAEGAAALRVAGREIGPRRGTPAGSFSSVRRVRVKKGVHRFYLTGQDVRVHVRSKRLSLSGSGWFTLRLSGRGTYRLDTRRRAAWNARRMLLVGLTRRPARTATR